MEPGEPRKLRPWEQEQSFNWENLFHRIVVHQITAENFSEEYDAFNLNPEDTLSLVDRLAFHVYCTIPDPDEMNRYIDMVESIMKRASAEVAEQIETNWNEAIELTRKKLQPVNKFLERVKTKLLIVFHKQAAKMKGEAFNMEFPDLETLTQSLQGSSLPSDTEGQRLFLECLIKNLAGKEMPISNFLLIWEYLTVMPGHEAPTLEEFLQQFAIDQDTVSELVKAHSQGMAIFKDDPVLRAFNN